MDEKFTLEQVAGMITTLFAFYQTGNLDLAKRRLEILSGVVDKLRDELEEQSKE